MKNKIFFIIIPIIVIFILVLVATTKFFWSFVKCSFFEYSLMDIANVVCTILIGLVVTIYLSHTFSNSNKRLEILVEDLNNFQSYYECISEVISESHQKNLTEPSKIHLLRLFKFASSELHNLQKFLVDETNEKKSIQESLTKIRQEHLALKKITTDTPFGQGQIITENDIKYSTGHILCIKQNIQKIKLNLYK